MSMNDIIPMTDEELTALAEDPNFLTPDEYTMKKFVRLSNSIRKLRHDLKRLQLINDHCALCFDSMKPMHEKEFEEYRRWMRKMNEELEIFDKGVSK